MVGVRDNPDTKVESLMHVTFQRSLRAQERLGKVGTGIGTGIIQYQKPIGSRGESYLAIAFFNLLVLPSLGLGAKLPAPEFDAIMSDVAGRWLVDAW